MSDKRKFSRGYALDAALELCGLLKPVCLPDRLMICGSLRRNRDLVSDIEIVYVSKSHPVQDGFFDAVQHQEVDDVLMCLLSQGVLKKRKTKRDTSTWGPFNKLAVHASGVPVDFFAATEGNWWNQVVCRTGSAENNIRIAAAAKAKKMKWHPYGEGFTDARHGMGELIPVRSEEDVFRIVGLPYLQPSQR